MTQAHRAAKGLATPPPLDRWIEAVLLLCVRLVHGVVTTLGMWWRVGRRDWHTSSDGSALPQAKSDNHLQKDTSTHGVILGLVPRISVGTSRGLSIDPLETHNRDSRDKPENDTAVVAATRTEALPPPNGGGAPRTVLDTSGFRWGTAPTTRTVRTRGHTVPHLTCARCTHIARSASPIRRRNTSAPA